MMKKSLKSVLWLMAVIFFVTTPSFGQSVEEKVLVQKAAAFYKAAAKSDWKTLYFLSGEGKTGKLPAPKEWIKYWIKGKFLILENPSVSNLSIDQAEASLRITFHYESRGANTKSSLLPYSYDFSFKKISDQWKIKSFEPAANHIVKQFISAQDLIQENELLERESGYLMSWEGIDVLDFAERDYIKDATTIPKFQRLFEAVINKSHNDYIKGEACWHLGKSFTESRDFKKARHFFVKGIELGEAGQFEYVLFLNLIGLSEIQAYEKETEKSEQSFEKAFRFYSSRADAHLNAVWASSRVGNTFFNTQNYEKAIKIYQEGIKVAENFNSNYWQIVLLKDIGDSYFQLKNYQDAQIWYERTVRKISNTSKSEPYHDWLPEIYRTIGNIFMKNGQAESARQSYEKSVELANLKKNPESLLNAYNSLARFHKAQNDPIKTIEVYNTLWMKLLELKAVAELTESIGDGVSSIMFDLGRIKEAEQLLDNWLNKGEALLKGKNLTTLLLSKAAVQVMQFRFKDAETTFRRMVLVADGNSEHQAFAYLGLAFIYAIRDDLEQGFHMFEEFEKLILKTGDKESIRYIKFIKNVILIIKNVKVSKIVDALFQQILNENQEDKNILALTHIIQAGIILYQISEVEKTDLDDGEILDPIKYKSEFHQIISIIDKSLEYSQGEDDVSKLLSTVCRLIKTVVYFVFGDLEKAAEVIRTTINKRDSLISKFLPELKYFEGQIYIKSKKWQEARKTLREAIAGFEKQNKNVSGGIHGRLINSKTNQQIYKQMVKTLLELKQIDEALLYSDRSKGGIILELNEIRKKREFDLVPSKTNAESPEAHRPSPIRKSLVPSWKRYEDFMPGARIYIVNENEEEEPENETSLEMPKMSLEQTKALLPNRDTALLEFFVDEDYIYLFILADDAPRNATETEWRKMLKWKVHSIKNDYLLENKIEELQKQIRERKMYYNEYCRDVYDRLIQPVETYLKDKSNWIIIPDEFIWKVPFKALQPKSGRFLINDYNISLAASLNVLIQTKDIKMKRQTRTSIKTSKDILAIGIRSFNEQIFDLPSEKESNDFDTKTILRSGSSKKHSDSKIVLPSLPGAENEVEQIIRIYGENRVEKRTTPAETKAQFMKEAENYRIIHLATHGILDDEDPMNSSLVFGSPIVGVKNNRGGQVNGDGVNRPPTKAFLNEDRRLTTKEILEMSMASDLIILSACDTGNGTAVSGEGVIGLSWAFSAAGVPTIVSSQWTVNDESTSLLMSRFHQNLKSKENQKIEAGSISKALREAELYLMMEVDSKYAHPYYWAPFITIGEP